MIKRKSFTLIELIVCLAIISVMVMVIRVNFVNNKKTIAHEELNLIAESIENAKVFSIENRKIVVLKSDSENGTFNISSGESVLKKFIVKIWKYWIVLNWNLIQMEFQVREKLLSFHMKKKIMKLE